MSNDNQPQAISVQKQEYAGTGALTETVGDAAIMGGGAAAVGALGGLGYAWKKSSSMKTGAGYGAIIVGAVIAVGTVAYKLLLGTNSHTGQVQHEKSEEDTAKLADYTTKVVGYAENLKHRLEAAEKAHNDGPKK